jgi:AGCS family alanine or glycine:cation symporter
MRQNKAAIPLLLAGALASLPALAAPVATAPGIDQRIQDAVGPYTDMVAAAVFYAINIGGYQVPLILLWLITVAVFCTLYFRFINLRGFMLGFRLIRGDYSDKTSSGETSHFQALATALSGTVGLGNIAGVALAVKIGGPGATFWMIAAGVLGMASKFTECTLAVKYRQENADGTISGGPMYTLSRGIAEQYPALAPLGKVLGVLFALFCVGGAIGAGNLFQSNGAQQALVVITGGAETSWFAHHQWLFGTVLAIAVGVVIVGGMKNIARVTDKLVPLMAGLYLLGGIAVLAANAGAIPDAIMSIFRGAFMPEGIAGGAVGVMLTGFRRAAFSNEAGIGTAAIAHSAVRTRYPVTEGLVSLWEPFVDTVVICTMTALVIVVTDAVHLNPSDNGVALTAAAFGTLGSWAPYLLAVAVFLFAYSTMISYAYYGEKAATYLFGHSPLVRRGYQVIFLVCTPIGTAMSFTRLADFSDAVYFLMALPNVIGMYLLAPVVKRELAHFMEKLRNGEIRNVRVAPTEPVPSP